MTDHEATAIESVYIGNDVQRWYERYRLHSRCAMIKALATGFEIPHYFITLMSNIIYYSRPSPYPFTDLPQHCNVCWINEHALSVCIVFVYPFREPKLPISSGLVILS